MGDVLKFERGEANAYFCDTCAEWEQMTAAFFVYTDGTFRCTTCGTPWRFEDSHASGVFIVDEPEPK